MNLFQRSIRQRFQSQVFLESQIIFQELNGAAVQVHIYLLKDAPNELQKDRPVLESTVFVEGSKDWSGRAKMQTAIYWLLCVHPPILVV